MTKVQEGCVQLEIACDLMRWGLKFEVPSENGNKKKQDSTEPAGAGCVFEMVMHRPIYILPDD